MPNARQVKPGVYRVEWRDTKGRRKSCRVEATSQRQALASLGHLQATLNVSSVTLRAAIDRMVSEKWRHNKDQQCVPRAERWLELLGNIDISLIGTKDIQRGVSKLEEAGLTGATINRYLAALRAVLNRACRVWEEIPRVPHFDQRPERPKRIRFLTPAEETQLLKKLTDAGEHETHDLVVFLLDTGFRVSEALAIEWQDITPDLTMATTWENKADHPRTVPLTRRARDLLLRRKEMGRPFAYQYHYYWERFNSAAIVLGWNDVTIHTLRHTCASRLVQEGVPIYDVKTWLGHKQITTTERYAHLAPQTLDRARQALER